MNSIQQAAERLRQHKAEEAAGKISQEYKSDVELLADAYLAEHPADSDIAIDWNRAEEMLADSEFGLAQRDGQLFAVVPERDVPLKTIGQLRRLGAALQITLKEPANGKA